LVAGKDEEGTATLVTAVIPPKNITSRAVADIANEITSAERIDLAAVTSCVN
jgi:hypothetical protein